MLNTFTENFGFRSTQYSPFVKKESLRDNNYYYGLERQLKRYPTLKKKQEKQKDYEVKAKAVGAMDEMLDNAMWIEEKKKL